MADANSTLSYSSGLCISVFQDRSKRGAFNMFKKAIDAMLPGED